MNTFKTWPVELTVRVGLYPLFKNPSLGSIFTLKEQKGIEKIPQNFNFLKECEKNN